MVERSTSAPVGCFGACSDVGSEIPLNLALKNHKSLMKESKNDVITVGNLKKQALNKAMALRKECVFASNTATMPLDVDYHNWVNKEIKQSYPEKLDKLTSQLEAHVFNLEGRKRKTKAKEMLEHVRTAKGWVDTVPNDAVPATTYTLHGMNEQKKTIDGILREMSKSFP